MAKKGYLTTKCFDLNRTEVTGGEVWVRLGLNGQRIGLRWVTIDAQGIKDSGKNQPRDERWSMDGLKSQKSPKMKKKTKNG